MITKYKKHETLELAVDVLDTTSEAQSMEENTQKFGLTKIKKIKS